MRPTRQVRRAAQREDGGVKPSGREFFIFTSAPPAGFLDMDDEATSDLGVIGYTDDDGRPHPAMTSDRKKVELMKGFARDYADKYGVQVRLMRFASSEIVWSTHS